MIPPLLSYAPFLFRFLCPLCFPLLKFFFVLPGFQRIFGFLEVSNGQGLLSHVERYLCLVAFLSYIAFLCIQFSRYIAAMLRREMFSVIYHCSLVCRCWRFGSFFQLFIFYQKVIYCDLVFFELPGKILHLREPLFQQERASSFFFLALNGVMPSSVASIALACLKRLTACLNSRVGIYFLPILLALSSRSKSGYFSTI